MNNNHGFHLGFSTYARAMKFIFMNKMGWYFIFPLILNVLLFLIGFFSISSFGDDILLYLNEWLDIEHWNFWGSGFLADFVKGFIYVIIHLLFFVVYAYFGGYVILILMSPVFAILSEQTERIITGHDFPFNISRFFKDVVRGALLAVRNLIVELLFTFLLFVISFIPVVGYFTPVALFLLSAYFYGFSFIDYTLERHLFKMHASVRYVRSNKGLAIGNGLVFSLVLLIPFIGVMLAGFISIVSVVAATIAVGETINDENKIDVTS